MFAHTVIILANTLILELMAHILQITNHNSQLIIYFQTVFTGSTIYIYIYSSTSTTICLFDLPVNKKI